MAVVDGGLEFPVEGYEAAGQELSYRSAWDDSAVCQQELGVGCAGLEAHAYSQFCDGDLFEWSACSVRYGQAFIVWLIDHRTSAESDRGSLKF